MYLLNDAKDILQNKLLEKFVDKDNNIDEIFEKAMFLTTALMGKYTIIEMMGKKKRMKN